MTVCPPLADRPEAWGTVGAYMSVHGIHTLASDPEGPKIRICPTCKKRSVAKHKQRCSTCTIKIRRVYVRVAVRKVRRDKEKPKP
jgi:hypothetical protein